VGSRTKCTDAVDQVTRLNYSKLYINFHRSTIDIQNVHAKCTIVAHIQTNPYHIFWTLECQRHL